VSSSLADLHAAKAPSEVVASIGMPGAVLFRPRHTSLRNSSLVGPARSSVSIVAWRSGYCG
jgi:hypothetical protein